MTGETIYLVRHGETEWNVERRLQGHTLQLEAQGQEVALLAMMDAWPEENTQIPIFHLMHSYERRLRWLARQERSVQSQFVTQSARSVVRRIFSTKKTAAARPRKKILERCQRERAQHELEFMLALPAGAAQRRRTPEQRQLGVTAEPAVQIRRHLHPRPHERPQLHKLHLEHSRCDEWQQREMMLRGCGVVGLDHDGMSL